MTRRTQDIIGLTAGLVLVAGFCSGILLAVGTGQALWLLLSALCAIVLGAG